MTQYFHFVTCFLFYALVFCGRKARGKAEYCRVKECRYIKRIIDFLLDKSIIIFILRCELVLISILSMLCHPYGQNDKMQMFTSIKLYLLRHRNVSQEAN